MEEAGSDETPQRTVPQVMGGEPRSPAMRATAAVENLVEHGADRLWRRLRRRPYVGVVLAGGLGVLLADFVGVGEIAIGALVAYAAYQMLAKNEPPSKALRQALGLEKELGL